MELVFAMTMTTDTSKDAAGEAPAKPRYQTISAALKDDIATGRCPLGSNLPTEQALGKEGRLRLARMLPVDDPAVERTAAG